MSLPVGCIEVGVGNGRSTVNHHSIPHIDAAVGHAVRVGRVIGVLEKYQIAGAGVGGGNRGTDVAKALRPQPPIVPAGVIDNPAYKAGAIKGV